MRLLVGFEQAAHLLQPLFAHAHLRQQFHHLAQRVFDLVETHGAHHAPRHPLPVAHVSRCG